MIREELRNKKNKITREIEKINQEIAVTLQTQEAYEELRRRTEHFFEKTLIILNSSSDIGIIEEAFELDTKLKNNSREFLEQNYLKHLTKRNNLILIEEGLEKKLADLEKEKEK